MSRIATRVGARAVAVSLRPMQKEEEEEATQGPAVTTAPPREGFAMGAPVAYPERWEADVALSDGGTMQVRPIRPDDAERIVAFHERQSPESIYLRFFSPRPRLSPRDLERFTNVDYVDRMAFVGLIGDDLVGVARYDRHRARSDAEVAFFIDDEHHGRGMATVLLEYLAVAAREAGISGFTASVLPQNRKMLGVFTQAGFQAHSRFEEGVVEVELAIDPTPEALAAIEERARAAGARSVERLLRPHSIAVVGASRTEGTIGHAVFHHLVSRGFEGPVYPVNPEASHVSSVRAWGSVLDVPGELDVAVICVPADQVMRVVEECAVQRVQGLIVISSGFADRDAAGELEERRLVSFARRHGMRLIGPNCLGVINTAPDVRMHATFAAVEPLPGRVALSAQSGVIGAAIIEQLRAWGLGVSTFVAVGNKSDVSGNDLLEYWQDDPETDVVLMYLESFGNPRKFSRTARAVSRHKPIVAVKVGQGVDEGWEQPDGWPPDATIGALLEQSGVIRVDTLTQMFHTTSVLAHQPLPAGRRVAVLTNSWGPASLAADAIAAAGLELASPSDATRAAVEAVVPPGDRVRNPVDLSNQVDPEAFGVALRALLVDEQVDAVLVLYAPAIVACYEEVARAVSDAVAAHPGCTVLACLLGDHDPELLRRGPVTVPEFPFPEEAALSLARVARYAEQRREPPGTVPTFADADVDRACRLVADWLTDHGDSTTTRWLDPVESADLLATVGLATVDQRLAADAGEAVAAAREIGYPVALKATGLARLSKTEAGGVSLDVHGDDEVRQAYERMVAVLGDAMRPCAVQAMVPEGAECRIGVHRHPVIGDVITLGPGGALAERVDDVALRILPLTDADAERLVDASRVGRLLEEAGPTARQAVVDLLLRLATLADAVPEIARIRFNPVLVSGGVAAITDARIGLESWTPDPRPAVRRL
ncbi:MAG: CoA-binding domain protein [Acidimicrobiales bacterium]|nr:CoA-binding domain protein [Acidimicrobiales bacterium]